MPRITWNLSGVCGDVRRIGVRGVAALTQSAQRTASAVARAQNKNATAHDPEDISGSLSLYYTNSTVDR